MCVEVIVCAQTVGARTMRIHQIALVLAARNSGARRGRSTAGATLVRLQLDPQPITTVKNRRVPAELAAVSSAAASKAAPTPDLRASRPSMRLGSHNRSFLPFSRPAERASALYLPIRRPTVSKRSSVSLFVPLSKIVYDKTHRETCARPEFKVSFACVWGRRDRCPHVSCPSPIYRGYVARRFRARSSDVARLCVNAFVGRGGCEGCL